MKRIFALTVCFLVFAATARAQQKASAPRAVCVAQSLSTPLTLIFTTAAPGAAIGTAYVDDLGPSAHGGTPPYTFAVTSGALPPGLTLSAGGRISGTPTKAGNFSFTVTVADSSVSCNPGTPAIPAAARKTPQKVTVAINSAL
jgi:hypothetical protein